MKNFAYLLLTTATLTFMVSCKQKSEQQNPLLAEWETQFGVPPFDQIEVGHYMPAFEAAIAEHNAQIDSIVSNSEPATFVNTILALDNSGELLDRVSTVFGLLSEAESTPEMRAVEEQLSPVLSAHNDNITLNAQLFERVKAVYDKALRGGLDSLQMRLTDKTYKRFVRAGALLDEEKKEELKQINAALSLATLRFGNNLLAENAKYQLVLEEGDLGGLPESVKHGAKDAATKARLGNDKWLFDISKPSMLPFLTYSDRADLRNEIYEAYTGKCNHDDQLDNKELINKIVELRTRKANLLGFKTFAQYTLDRVMAKNPANVYNLLDEIWTPALKRAKEELSDMKRIMAAEGKDSTTFRSSDWWYYAEKVRKEKYNLEEEALRPYFSLDNVRQGIFNLSNRLYGLTFRPVALPVYNNECSTYEVIDVDGSHLGVLYLDFFPRATKRSGAWCGEYREQSYKDGKRIAPVVTIVANFTKPTESTPALLSLDEVETFFHEFGHALHGLMADVKYKGLMGVERDFVELPSQIMENWAVEPEMLRTYALHYNTGAVMPDYLIEKIGRSATFNQGFTTLELAAASLSDMDIHNLTAEQLPIDVNDFETETLNRKRGMIDQIEPRYRYPYFAHIFSGGYSAGYYSYLWAEVLDKDAYQAFVESGDKFDRKVAARLRRLLSQGGEKEGMDLYREFRGADPSRKPLLVSRGLIAPDPVPEETEIEQAEQN